MIRVLLVDDSPSVRAVLKRFFRKTPDIQVVGEAADGAEAVRAVIDLQPQVVVMDLQMPVLDGYEATERIMAVRPTPIIVVSTRDRPEDRLRGLKVGADAYLTKQSLDAGELVDLVRRLSGSGR